VTHLSERRSEVTDQVLKDKLGNTIGKISTASNGIQTIKDRLGNIKGSYDPKRNETKDKLGNTVGTGNLLTTLLDL
jgi:hypothetical protein